MKKKLFVRNETLFDELYGWIALYYFQLLVTFMFRKAQNMIRVKVYINKPKSRY
jgi:hypothetical protein